MPLCKIVEENPNPESDTRRIRLNIKLLQGNQYIYLPKMKYEMCPFAGCRYTESDPDFDEYYEEI
ncbi:MAG: hypothetical protein ACFFDN_00835 [Candidatus Hodarchaeota archaeon]